MLLQCPHVDEGTTPGGMKVLVVTSAQFSLQLAFPEPRGETTKLSFPLNISLRHLLYCLSDYHILSPQGSKSVNHLSADFHLMVVYFLMAYFLMYLVQDLLL